MFFMKLNIRKKEQKRYDLTLEELSDIANFHHPTPAPPETTADSSQTSAPPSLSTPVYKNETHAL